jgi:thymidylate synthase
MFAYELSALTEQEWEIDNRAKWKDGSQVMTKRIIQSFNHYDLTEGFPILALREINYKAAIDEAIWVFIQMSNNTNDLNSTIWKSWENEKNQIAYAYGHQIAKPTMGHPSQMHYVINEIKTNPTSRRIMMNMYSAEEQHLKGLIECAYSTHFSVKDGKLHMTLIQRSGDAIVAAGIGSWNVVQYAFLQHAIAKECGLQAGDFTHFVQDLHIYNKHEEQAEELLERYYNLESLQLPTIEIADKPFFELTADDVELVGYKHHGKIKRLDVAI